ncbi:MAG: tRNA (N(6)-L-threonylcarbamoyladenosine(37)-C(2))-methylthiotransferase MtaB [Calditrichaeota bacterium]|nr:tRNA (N(6)-L-threonylcarbamoyladenosine(37)-C(2))-methylthiotransferase MtaB [Calditrichota bacterium]
MKKISFYTLGCKLNQSESAIMAEQFREQGYEVVPFGKKADVCVINTCTVTAKTDYRCRQMIRRAKKLAPDAKIAVVGCYAQLHPETIREIEGVDFILGSDRKFDLLPMLETIADANEAIVEKSDNKQFQAPASGYFWNHTRGFLKIQDGCDNFCAYCAVPLARGRSRSDHPDEILAHAEKLVAAGHRELVLTGVHIGMYGKDLQPPVTLLDVIKNLEKIDGLERIRLSSLEPNEINDALLEHIANSEKICRHLHVPLQSGDDEILKRMRRLYRRQDFVEIIQKIKFYLPHCGLGTDVIVGFPGETEEHFQNTVEIIESLPFTYLHVFSYSVRPGTAAAKFSEQVDSETIKRRSETLRKIGKQKKQEFYRSFVGKTVRVLWETKTEDGWMTGLTAEYVRAKAKADLKFVNKFAYLKVEKAREDFVLGAIVDFDSVKR